MTSPLRTAFDLARCTITAHGRDLDRDAALADLGWLVIRVTKAQLDRPDALAARVRRILEDRSRRDWSDC